MWKSFFFLVDIHVEKWYLVSRNNHRKRKWTMWKANISYGLACMAIEWDCNFTWRLVRQTRSSPFVLQSIRWLKLVVFGSLFWKIFDYSSLFGPWITIFDINDHVAGNRLRYFWYDIAYFMIILDSTNIC